MEGSGVRRGDDADPRREGRQGSLARFLEQTLGLQPRFQFLEAQVEVTHPDRTHALRLKLVFSTLGIERHPAINFERVAIARRDRLAHGGAAPHDTAKLRFLVFQREVPVTGARQRHIRDFAGHPYALQHKIAFDQAAQIFGQFADGLRFGGAVEETFKHGDPKI